MRPIFVALVVLSAALAADPTFLKRSIADARPLDDGYRPLFGSGDPDARHLKSIARYGELTVPPRQSVAMQAAAAEEQIFYILAGKGRVSWSAGTADIRENDFLYLPPGVAPTVANSADSDVRLLVMGFRIPEGAKPPPAREVMTASADDVPLQQLAGHGPTTQFKLLMGTTESKRDKLAAASQMVSLFIMDFAPGGTNIPHHHETEEEIYFILRGSGQMVAGGGIDGNEGRHPAKAGDAWFLRLNTTVGFYSGAKPGEPHDLILAVRSTFPFPRSRK